MTKEDNMMNDVINIHGENSFKTDFFRECLKNNKNNKEYIINVYESLVPWQSRTAYWKVKDRGIREKLMIDISRKYGLESNVAINFCKIAENPYTAVRMVEELYDCLMEG